MSNNMEILSEITQNTHSLLSDVIFEAIAYGVLCIIGILVSIGVMVLDKEMALRKRWTLLISTIALTIAMAALEFYTIRPVYLDYTEQSYVTVENAIIKARGGFSGSIFVKNQNVILYNDDYTERIILKNEDRFPMLYEDTVLKGTIVYLKRSRYIVWRNVE